MEHFMKLREEHFELIRTGNKVVEIRLYDEKMREIDLCDVIVFMKMPDLNVEVRVKVIGLLRYCTFEQLVYDVPFSHFGYEDKTRKWMLERLNEIYSPEEEEKYGVLGIRIEPL